MKKNNVKKSNAKKSVSKKMKLTDAVRIARHLSVNSVVLSEKERKQLAVSVAAKTLVF